MAEYERNGTLINRKFFQYLMPTVLSTVAISLNEFVDSIIVSQLLGSNAMSMVNMGFPVMLAFAVIYTLLGVGGSVMYSEYAGKQEQNKADRYFTLTMVLSITAGILSLAGGTFLLDTIASRLCRDQSLLPEFTPYLKTLYISALLIIPLQVLITFFPALGSPEIGTVLNIVANAVNLLMDYVYIHFFSTGLKGAALATLTGYVVGVVLVVVLVITKKTKLPFTLFGTEELKDTVTLVTSGAAPAMNQFSYCIKISFCNTLAMDLAGIGGVTVFALCMQVVSIVSVIICGIVNSMTPIAASLKGQGDTKGIDILMRTVIRTQFISNVVLVLILEAFPQFVLAIYAVEAELTAVAATGLRIFSVMFVFRGFILVYIYYFQAMSRKLYASILSILDGFAGLIPLALLFTSLIGINGLWLAFPVLSLLMLAGIAVTNHVIISRSGGKYRGMLLTENEGQDLRKFELTIPLAVEDTVINARSLQEFCLENGVSEYVSSVAAVALEEMAVYTIEHNEIGSSDVLDLIVKVNPEDISMNIRSVGKPFDITSADNERFSNIDVLRKIADSVNFSYIMGMNHTKILISK